MTQPTDHQHTDQHQTLTHVADMASQDVHLERLALIGVFGSSDARGALVRARSGKISRVVVGDRVAGRTVAAIGEDSVILSRGSSTKVLRLPGS